ncbi:helix-turn-helix domain-containing protein [Paenibacillus solisilvae]|uniref:Helix-turn-helix domain-containing protein n=1 Tax=Paenibacillus solisilvae TaxID=2486751 RepID=A0ABW0VR56_9BACL
MNSHRLGAIYELQPTVNFIGYTEADIGTAWGPRRIPDYQIFYVVSGEAEVWYGQQHFHLGPGDCTFYGPQIPHKLVIKKPVVYFSLHFLWQHSSPVPEHPAYKIEPCSEDELLRHVRTDYYLDIPGQESLHIPPVFPAAVIEPYLMRIVNEYLNEQPGYAIVLRALLTELIAGIVRDRLASRPHSIERMKIDPALRAISGQPEKNWTIPELAALCGYHVIYFSSLFRKCTGASPKQYLISERIRKAKYYLLSGEKAENIASKLGYASIHYFSRNFKEETGLTPTEFKQQEL